MFMTACASTNIVEDKISITGNTELVKMDYEVCGQYQSTATKIYSCSSAFSKDLEISKDKSLLNSKANLIDTYNGVLSKNQSMNSTDNSKGIIYDYDNQIRNSIDDSLVKYEVVFSKSFQESNGFRTFTITSMSII